MNPIRVFHIAPRAWLLIAAFHILCSGEPTLQGQGCIAIRPGFCQIEPREWFKQEAHATTGINSTNLVAADWVTSLGFSWFKSDRHFRGRHEEANRQTDNTEVINDVMSWTLGLTYVFDSQLSATATLPFQYATRSSLYEHDRITRHTTRSSGIQDARVTLNYWLKDPHSHPRFNIALGIGIKIPTGDDAATDTFYTDPDGDPLTPVVPVKRPVDQSIQPGDGGWGIPLEMQAYWSISPRWSAYANGLYLLNPHETNGTPTSRRRANEAIMSVADQYFGRLGFGYDIKSRGPLTTMTLGGRVEGIHTEDAIGGSAGFRRPGYTVSIEPGIIVASHKWQFALTAPVALLRNRVQSLTDRQNSTPGNIVHGDAAFADFSVVGTIAYRF